MSHLPANNRTQTGGLDCFWAIDKGKTQAHRTRTFRIRPPSNLHASFLFNTHCFLNRAPYVAKKIHVIIIDYNWRAPWSPPNSWIKIDYNLIPISDFFRHTTISLYSCALFSQATLTLVFWSHLPLYTLAVTICASTLKVLIEVCSDHHNPCRNRRLMYESPVFQERTILEDPKLGDQYKLYKIKVPYRMIPYVW